MFKKSTTIILCAFLFTIVVFSYFCYAIYSQTIINTQKDRVVAAQKAWNNYFRIVNKVNTRELSHIASSSDLITTLKNLDINVQKKSLPEINKQINTLEDYIYSKTSNDIDLIVVYSADGITRAGIEKDLNEVPYINLPEVIARVLDGENIALNINLKGNLYYVNLAPVISDGRKLGVVLVGKQLNNSTTAYVKELSGTNLVILTKEKLLASSLPYLTAEKIFEQFRQIDPQMMQLLKSSNPADDNKVFYLNLHPDDFWAAGGYIIDKTSAFILLENNSRWVRPYIILKDKMNYVIPLVLLITVLCGILFSKLFGNFTSRVAVKTSQMKDKVIHGNKSLNRKVDRKIDDVLNRILAFFNIDFFRHNKELQEISLSIFSMVKQYKAKIVVENFSDQSPIKKMLNPISRNDCSINPKKTTMYFSNIKDFTQLIEYFSPARAFTILSIYTKIQQEIIAKYNGRIIKQVDDRLVAVFESRSSAEDAIRAAFEVQNTIHKLSAVNPENIELSIAVSSGDAIVANVLDQIMYLGYAAKVGNRLCDETPSSWIYIDKLTYDIAGIEELNAKQDMLVIKGISSPIQFYKFDPDLIISFNLDKTKNTDSYTRIR